MKIKNCKYCGSSNLILEPRITGQNVLTADMVSLRCKDCGKWLKWCPKDERTFYYKKTKTKWEKLKEWLTKDTPYFCKQQVLNKMQELEKDNE